MRLVVTMIMGFVLGGRVLLIDLCMWTRNGARTLPVVLDRDQWCGNCNHRIIKDGVDYCPKRDLIFFRRLEMEEIALDCPYYPLNDAESTR